MILDRQVLFSDAQAITATAASTNIVDLGVMGKTHPGAVTLKRKIGVMDIPLLFQVVEAFNNLTSLKVAIETDEDVAFGSPKVVAEFTILLADLTLGKQLPYVVVPRYLTERYLRFNYTVTGAAPTTGKVTAGIVAAVDSPYMG